MKTQLGKTLYKRSTVGKLLQWSVFVDGDKFYGVHGQVGGQLVEDAPTVCTPKNVGRSNETTAEEQAVLEAKAKWTKKRDINNYCENKADADKKKFTVTLAHRFDKFAKKLPDAVFSSPKLDGIRCYITKDGAFSRNGKRFVSTKFIEQDLVNFFKENPDATLDGELYNHSYKDNFPELVRLIKREKNFTDEQWKRIKDDLEFHIFDVFYANAPKEIFKVRIFCLDNALGNLTFSARLELVIQTLIMKDEHLEHYSRYMAEGYEGQMLRDPDSVYEMKRSYGLQKVKKFDSDEFPIAEVLEGKGNRAGMAGKIVVDLPNGKTCEAGLRGNQTYFTELWENREAYIGKKAQTNYFGYTPEGKLRFPVMVAVRDYE